MSCDGFVIGSVGERDKISFLILVILMCIRGAGTLRRGPWPRRRRRAGRWSARAPRTSAASAPRPPRPPRTPRTPRRRPRRPTTRRCVLHTLSFTLSGYNCVNAWIQCNKKNIKTPTSKTELNWNEWISNRKRIFKTGSPNRKFWGKTRKKNTRFENFLFVLNSFKK